MKNLYHQTLINSANLIDHNQLANVSQALKKAKRIDFYTSAGNIYFAQKFMFQMAEIGVTVNVPLEDYQQRLCTTNSNHQKIALIMSFEGRGDVIGHIGATLKKTKPQLS